MSNNSFILITLFLLQSLVQIWEHLPKSCPVIVWVHVSPSRYIFWYLACTVWPNPRRWRRAAAIARSPCSRRTAARSPRGRRTPARSPGRRRILLGVPRRTVHGDGVHCGLLRYSGGRRRHGSMRRRRRRRRGSMRRKKRGLSQTSQVSWCCLHVEISRVGPTFFLLAMHTTTTLTSSMFIADYYRVWDC